MKTIYLAGPINGRDTNEIATWREMAKGLWFGNCLDPMNRDYPHLLQYVLFNLKNTR